MSHFTVLVVGNDVEKQLAPYHEFECTGEDNEYVQNIDETDEARKEYESQTELRYQDPEGNLHNPYQNQFYREFTEEERKKHGPMLGSGCGGGQSWTSKDWDDGQGYRTKMHFMPEGWTEVRVNTNTVESFAEFIEGWYGHETLKFDETPNLGEKHKYGWTQLDENGEVVKVIDRTNPSAKWDWYQIGGRWSGFFKLKSNAESVLSSRLGTPSLLTTMDPDYKPPTADRADQCLKNDIDIEGMRDEAGRKAGEAYDKFLAATVGCPPHLSWDEVKRRNQKAGTDSEGEPNVNYEAAREEYGDQPAVKALRESKDKDVHWYEPDDFLCTREEYVNDARQGALATFAVIKDGKWYQRGEMGWWGVVTKEKDRNEWLTQFSNMIDSLPDDTLLTIVDCHI
jgi:hypothetical protein